MKQFIYFHFLLVLSLSLNAQEHQPSITTTSLAQLAQKADAIVLAQVRDTDYFYRHEYPVGGSAFIKVLISYKLDRPANLIEVYENGLHQNECYFPNRTVFEEGRRYLLFLKHDPEQVDRYRGLTEGCALEVLVDSNNRYVLRVPADGIRLSDPLMEAAVELTFSDPYSIENDENLTSEERDRLLQSGSIIPYEAGSQEADTLDMSAKPPEPPGRQWIYTRGIDLSVVRKLMQLPAKSQIQQ